MSLTATHPHPALPMQRLGAALARCVPDSLFGRLALLLVAVALASHVLALSLMFEFRHMGPPPTQLPHHAGMPPGPHGPPLEGMLMDIAVRLSAVLLAAWVGARWLAAPIRQLAESTRDLAQNIHRAPIAEQGTRECREATHVINQLQQHIRAQLAERDQFVAAVSHDLRTPLTRLKLRTQSLQSDAERQRFGRDITEMDSMIRVTLDYLRGAADPEPWVELDLVSLLQSQVHDNQDCGFAVNLQGAANGMAPLPLRAQLSALRRCIANLVDNAVRYGGSAELSLSREADTVCIRITDNGPGIPEAELSQVLLPFYRVEASRNRHTGGVGLGLATAHDIARMHGGSLVLSNREGCGLLAELRFPLRA
ncbi:two-component sensor histidine kinase [Rhodoferax lacus]|uniref:histidine kinase n=1 Tax=Rhodoferax lacus TaxID=2184758 RepID=A0A3E1RIT8_9BURK|nr:ATP-binding protein [Rhodoferax lacus]RFO98912.1 two-component sensor histidine kinase [Rhodoferax lacus]